MALASGTRLGPYEILAPIGAGGMGEVYKANDTRLDRTVAIKVLPEHLADSPERKQRFEREAKAISQLNHPHICTLYDVGSQNGIAYLVMEYLEGETLTERLEKGSLPLDDALEYGMQIADGLDKAHRAGIVPRDLKPGNIIIVKPGVKILDFGLAKLVEKPALSDSSDAPTQQRNLTKDQAIVGTLQYMAPEQLEGKPVDARSDVWAIGAVLYEMITGRRAFEASTLASLIAAILEHEPVSMAALNKLTPPAVDRLARICLAKDPENRWQTARDVTRELKSIADGETGEVEHVSGRGSSRLLVGILAGAILGAIVVGIAYLSLEPTSEPALAQRFRIVLPEELGRDGGHGHAISSDGRYLAIEGGDALYVRHTDGLSVEPIVRTRVGNLTISPDGQWVWFTDRTQLKRSSISGGAPTTIYDLDDSIYGTSWVGNDTVVYAARDGIFRVTTSGGAPELVLAIDAEKGERAFGPELLADGTWALFTLATGQNWQRPRVVAQSIASGERRVLVEAGSDARYLPTGHLVYAHRGTLMAVELDTSRIELIGSPVPVIDGVRRASAAWANIYRPAHFSFSRQGTLVYALSAELVPPMELVWVKRDGSAHLATESRRAFYLPRISPDGKHVALGLYDSEADSRNIWLLDLDRDALTRFTVGDGNATDAIWTSDGARVTFSSDRLGSAYQIFSKPVGGIGQAEQVLRTDTNVFPRLWTRNDRALVFMEFVNQVDINMLPADGEAQPLVATEHIELEPSLSPDNRWLAYVSHESGRPEVYVRAFRDAERQWQISTEGGRGPLWAADGRELFYRNGDKMMAVTIDTDADLSPSPPAVLFEGQYTVDPFANDARNYDISPDGERFLMVRESQVRAKADELYVVVNWFEELKRLVPIEN